jgi:tetratricopeptide (TPR) repeat protein
MATVPTEEPNHEQPTGRAMLRMALEPAREALAHAFANRVAGVVIAIVAGSSLSLAGLMVYLRHSGEGDDLQGRPAEELLAESIEALEAGSLLRAQRLAAALIAADSLPPEQSGGPPFVLGVIAASDAERLWGNDRRRYFRLAASYLQQAQQAGFPPGREGEGLFLLGKSLVMSGQIAPSRPVLEAALAAYPQESAVLHRYLAIAHKSEPDPNLPKAFEHITNFLSTAALDRNDRAEGWLLQAQVLFQTGRLDECRESLAKINLDTEAGVESLIVQGEVLMAKARQLKADQRLSPGDRRSRSTAEYTKAIEILRQAQNRGTDRERITRRSMYLIGHCYLEMDDLRAALDQFRRTHETYMEAEEGIAAGVEQAELLRRLGIEAGILDVYLAVIKAAGAGATYINPLLPFDKLRTRVLDAFQTFVKAGNYKAAATLAGTLYPLFPQENAVALTAQVHQNWAEALESQAGKTTGEAMARLLRDARTQHRLAGERYAKLAELRFASTYHTEDLWNSAESYLKGHDHARAILQLQEYLRYELRRRRPRALLDLGDAQLAVGRPQQALLTLQECIDTYPRDPASYRARLVAARAQIEQGNLPQAKKHLLSNLEGTELTPDSVEWRDSLFTYGLLLHDEGQMLEAQARDELALALRNRSEEKAAAAERQLQQSRDLYRETIRRLEEAVARFSESPQVIESRYVIAESYRASAAFTREKLDGATIETARMELTREMHRLLEAAVGEYEQVQEILTRRREKSQLTPLEQSILRNCYFARGATFYELGRYDDAVTAYSAATNRYHHEPEVLDAFMQLANCYRRLNRPDEARGVIEQARLVLGRMTADDSAFARTTIHTRQEWQQVFDWLSAM